MVFGNILVLVFITYYTLYFIKLLNPKERKGVQMVNMSLDNMRTKKFKTIEEQKAFINLKYPRKGKFKWSWRAVPKILLHIIIFLAIYQAYNYLFKLGGIDFALWHAILIVMLAPILINLLLERFNLQKGDFRRMIK